MQILFSAGTVWGCREDASFVSEEDLKYPPADTIAFKAVIKKISSHGDLDREKPHGGFQLTLNSIAIAIGDVGFSPRGETTPTLHSNQPTNLPTLLR